MFIGLHSEFMEIAPHRNAIISTITAGDRFLAIQNYMSRLPGKLLL